MLQRDKIAIYITVTAFAFALFGMYLISNSEQSVTAAAVSQINKVVIGSEGEEELITEDILIKKDVGVGTTSIIVVGSTTTINQQQTSTIISTQSSVLTTSVFTTSTSSIATTSTLDGQSETLTLIPTVAKDNYGRDQVSPDENDYDGTVDLSNDDTRWLTVNGEYVQVDDWNNNIEPNAFIESVTANCEVFYVNNKPGFIEFSYDSGQGWSQWLCSQEAAAGTTFSCDLKQYGVDTANEINNLKLRCKMRYNQGGAGFALDYMYLEVVKQ